jgi:hypothetical protein
LRDVSHHIFRAGFEHFASLTKKNENSSSGFGCEPNQSHKKIFSDLLRVKSFCNDVGKRLVPRLLQTQQFYFEPVKVFRVPRMASLM